MQSIDFPALVTIMGVLVDDRYKLHAPRLLKGKVGAKPVFSDAEIITLIMAEDFRPKSFLMRWYTALFSDSVISQ